MQLPDGRIQLVTYSVADTDAGYVAAVSYSGEASPESFVAQEQVFSLLKYIFGHLCIIWSSDPGEEGWRSPETRPNLWQVGRKKYLKYLT